MSANPDVAGGSVRSSNGGQADDKRLKLGQEFDPRNNALNAFRLVGHDVGDAGVSRDAGGCLRRQNDAALLHVSPQRISQLAKAG